MIADIMEGLSASRLNRRGGTRTDLRYSPPYDHARYDVLALLSQTDLFTYKPGLSDD